ncbi:MAG: helicase [Watsoniomyces obsoletus]|nr:MAG: helicase [Watsoniomyces obsoletus]
MTVRDAAMLNKPFRPPLVRKASGTGPGDDRIPDVRNAKRRRVDTTRSEDEVDKTDEALLENVNPPGPQLETDPSPNTAQCYYRVLWRKFTTKKHKVWTGDGFLAMQAGFARLRDASGKELGKVAFNAPLLHGSTLSVAGNEVEVDAVITKVEYLKCMGDLDAQKPETPELKFTQKRTVLEKDDMPKVERSLNVSAPKSVATQGRFKNPLLSDTVLPQQDKSKPTPRHDPTQAGSLIMDRPPSVPPGAEVVDVVIDPILSAHLREHQRDGVRFLYNCVVHGHAYGSGYGAILADEMGLGKTLQTIALLWTLLKQNPIYGEPPLIKKAVVVCPATLLSNWRKEFTKWLGNERIGVLVADGTKKLTDFTHGKSYSVLVIGYERLRSVQEELVKGDGVDIVVADEGHRLKTAKNKSAKAITMLGTDRRILLSGTPIQNNLSEFFAMVDMVNPGALGGRYRFKKRYEEPIIRSRQPEASEEDIRRGEESSQRLAEITSTFILRRTADLISKHLPPKTEYVVLCRPTRAQINAYEAVIGSSAFNSILGSPEASLQLITLLKKVCNAPSLVKSKQDDEPGDDRIKDIASSVTATRVSSAPATASAKLHVLGRLLHHLRTSTMEKVVLISNYTATLDLLQAHLAANEFTFLRLDGTTPSSKRQDLVDSFNRSSADACFAFLLSAKAGGVGLNLIGASRLVLFEADWNPSTDLQAMARIHRDGQKKPVSIYRLLLGGGIDEKIWQRQITKMGLADSVIDQKASASSFTVEELRDLFTLDLESTCQTHNLLGCHCGGQGVRQAVSEGTPGQDIEVVDLVGDSDDEDHDEEENEQDDGDNHPVLPTLTKASKVNMERQEQRIKEQRTEAAAKAKPAATTAESSTMQALMRYSHIDVSKFANTSNDQEPSTVAGATTPQNPPETNMLPITDEVLRKVLQEDNHRVKFIFSKTSPQA